MRRKSWARALVVSRKLCRVAPHCCAGYLHAGFCLHELGKTAEAKKLLLQGPAGLRKEPIYYYNMGCYEALLGNMKDAQEHLERSFEMDASFREIAKRDPDLKSVYELL
jgi:Flp pilus assembly protein TadD